MANSNSMNINLDRNMVIARLKEKRVGLEHDYLTALKEEAEYNAAMAEYHNDVMEAVLKGIKDGTCNIDEVDTYYKRTNIRVNIELDVKKPERTVNSHINTPERLRSQMDQIDRNINLLEMCADATIKSKQYGNIIDFLS